LDEIHQITAHFAGYSVLVGHAPHSAVLLEKIHETADQILQPFRRTISGRGCLFGRDSIGD